MKFGSSTLYFEDGIIIKPDYDNLNLKIIQTEVGSRAYFIGGSLRNLTSSTRTSSFKKQYS